ncbi:PAS domain-containing protein [Leptolyngbya sp. FACHB-541]|uniref:PAS domain-containing sensor histidine kinase n=1 Tax=Leptolyngbya sp. FACHB-541 TaxID=2692810 RepID=UPI00168508B2|nr:PAS domain-containing protein [Leptolyngbya sp. FACHB-541]MBD1999710.1 PAS domain-containing protein [Leptolyngbya sp. FACHB-541]
MNPAFNQQMSESTPSPVEEPPSVEVEQLRLRLQAYETRQQQLLQAIPHLIWLADANKSVVWVNQHWCSYTGLTMAASLKQDFLQALHPQDRDRFLSLWQQAEIAANQFTLIYRLFQPNGTCQKFLVQLVPLSSTGQIEAWGAIHTHLPLAMQPDGIQLRDEGEGVEVVPSYAAWQGVSTIASVIGQSANLLTQGAIASQQAQPLNTLKEQENHLTAQNELLLQQTSKLAQQQQQIQQQQQQLQQSARLKSQFLATISHELRTPMNAIIGFSQLLLRQRRYLSDSSQEDMLQRILSNGRNLLSLINNILDLSNLEAGYLALNPENLDLGLLIRATVEEMRSQAEQKGLSLQVQSDLQMLMVSNDRTRLHQILVILISNAIKFTESGGILVSLEPISGDRALITIQDTGIGISKGDLSHIFERFRQADQSQSRRYSGAGLGLAIADWLIRIMGGDISVESSPGQGSTFRVELPRQVK